MSNKAITIISSIHNVSDARLQRIAIFLKNNGYDVQVISPGSSSNAPAGIEHLSLGDSKSPMARLIRDLTLPWKVKSKAIYCLAPDLLPISYLAAKKNNLILISDFYENYSKVLNDRSWGKGLKGIIFRPAAKIVTNLAINTSMKAHIVTVADQQLPPFDANNRFVLRNYPFLENTPSKYLSWKNNELSRNNNLIEFDTTPRAIYIGDIRKSRGLWQMLEIAKANPNWQFDFVGPVAKSEEKDVQNWIEANQRITLEKRAKVNFYGRLSPSKSWELAKGAWIGLSLLENTPAFIESFPSKVYEYAFMGIPVLSSELPRAIEIIQTGNFGLASKLDIEVLNNKFHQIEGKKNSFAENGIKWVMELINEDLEFQNFKSALDSLFSN